MQRLVNVHRSAVNKVENLSITQKKLTDNVQSLLNGWIMPFNTIDFFLFPAQRHCRFMYPLNSDHVSFLCVYLINSGQIFNIFISPLQVFLPLFQIFLQIYFSTTWKAKYIHFYTVSWNTRFWFVDCSILW